MSSKSSDSGLFANDTPATSVTRATTRESTVQLDLAAQKDLEASHESNGDSGIDISEAKDHAAPHADEVKSLPDEIDKSHSSNGIDGEIEKGAQAENHRVNGDKEGEPGHADTAIDPARADAAAVDPAQADAAVDPDTTAADDALRGKTIAASDLEITYLEMDLTDEIRYSSLARPLEKRKQDSKWKNRQALSYLVLVEDRIKALETKLQEFEAAKAAAGDAAGTVDSAAGDGTSATAPSDEKKDQLQLKVNWCDFDTFIQPLDLKSSSTVGSSVLDVLNEPWALGSKRSYLASAGDEQAARRAHLNTTSGAQANTLEVKHRDVAPKQEVHRIRINSIPICDAFVTIMGSEKAPKPGEIHIQPFKFLLTYYTEIQEYVNKLRSRSSGEKVQENEPMANGEPEAQVPSQEADTSKAGDSPDTSGEESTATMHSSDNETKPNEAVDDQKSDQDEELGHFEVLLDFMSTHLNDELTSYAKLRSRKTDDDVPRTSFTDLWKLFAPGDLVFDPKNQQVSRVVAAGGGRPLLRYKVASDPYAPPPLPGPADPTAGVAGLIGASIDEEHLNPFRITCLSLDFDGSQIVPILSDEHQIVSFLDQRSIYSLPVYPIEYANKAHADGSSSAKLEDGSRSSFEDDLRYRGGRFLEFASSTNVAHKEYNGLSLATVPQHIDSEIIVDPGYYYDFAPEMKPSMEFIDMYDGDTAEILESVKRPKTDCFCGNPKCTYPQAEIETKIYDDRNIGAQQRGKLIDDFPELDRGQSSQEELRTQHQILFPRRMYAYVLKDREWVPLDVSKIRDLPERRPGQDDLDLPEGHRTMVLSLINMHSQGVKPVDSIDQNGSKPNGIREDLVRGKGKGLIILLHGAPGVGKTSTAEWVAYTTKRPLYALTCGDVGENPGEVQKNLESAFRLAHRWGCVMLLDEADVFLENRGHADMRRNAVVAVFLRMLEYYSGILILTTNRVGKFDEAFKSRIHMSLYYKRLNLERSLTIWGLNLKRMKANKGIKYSRSEVEEWIKAHWRDISDRQATHWNGRQIHNACQTAAALAAYHAKDGATPRLTKKELDAVALASKEFDDFLTRTRGGLDDDDFAAQELYRANIPYEDGQRKGKSSDERRKYSRDRRDSKRDRDSRGSYRRHSPQSGSGEDSDRRATPRRKKDGVASEDGKRSPKRASSPKLQADGDHDSDSSRS